MSNYTNKEKIIIKQCNEGPFHTLVTKITLNEFNDLVQKLIEDDEADILICLVAIYWDYNRNKIIDYFIDKGDVELLLGLLDYCNDFSTPQNELDQKYVVDKLLSKNDKKIIKEFLDSKSTYFLRDKEQIERLIKFIS